MVDEIAVTLWPVERIPDEDCLYFRVHKGFMDRDGKPIPGAFRNRPGEGDETGGMSTDWCRYSTAEESRSRGRVPTDNAVIKLIAGQVREIPEQSVEHSPDSSRNNRAHTDVWGEKTAEVRIQFLRIYSTVIPLQSR